MLRNKSIIFILMIMLGMFILSSFSFSHAEAPEEFTQDVEIQVITGIVTNINMMTPDITVKYFDKVNNKDSEMTLIVPMNAILTGSQGPILFNAIQENDEVRIEYYSNPQGIFVMKLNDLMK